MLFIISASTQLNQQLLATARQKLLTTDVPQLLRANSFLRLSCLALNTPGVYPHLLKQLCSYTNWWATCEVTPAGTLISSNPEINLLLEPINLLHQPQALAIAA